MQARQDRSETTGMALAMAGGALLAIGSFMTWATASVDIPKFAEAFQFDVGTVEAAFQAQAVDTSTTVSGFDGSDGKITLVFGLLAIAGGVVLAMKTSRKIGATLAVVGGALGTLLALYDMTKAKDDALGDASAQFAALGLSVSLEEIIKVSIGIGLWVCLVGGILALVGGGLSFRGGPATTGAMPASGMSSGGRTDGGWGGSATPPQPPSTPPTTGTQPMGNTGAQMPDAPETGAPDEAPS